MTVPAEQRSAQQEAERYLELLYQNADRDHMIALTAIWRERPDHRERSEFFRPDQISDAASWALKQSLQQRNVYARTTTIKERPSYGWGKSDATAAVLGLWIDLDVKDGAFPDIETARKMLGEFCTLEPTMVVASGAGEHQYWIFNEPLDPTKGAALLARWKEAAQSFFKSRGYTVDSVFDLSRVMRIPGTFNFKPDVQKGCQLLADGGQLHNSEDFEPFLAVAKPKSEPKPVADESTVEDTEVDRILSGIKVPLSEQDGSNRLTKAVRACVECQLTDGQIRTRIDAYAKDAPPPNGLWTAKKIEQVIADVRKKNAIPEPNQPKKKTEIEFEIITAYDLDQLKFPPIEWLVQDIIPAVGLTVMAGAPKLGKSWLALRLALGIAGGGSVLGTVQVKQRGVWYWALEDNLPRLQKRERELWPDGDKPKALALMTRLPDPVKRQRTLDAIPRHLDKNPDIRLIIVDTLARTRPHDAGDGYWADSNLCTTWHELADVREIGVVIIHHTRKTGAEDVFDEISGTRGLSGVPDTNVILARGRNEADGILHVTGRDVPEQRLALRLDHPGGWTLLGEATKFEMHKTRCEIQTFLDTECGATLTVIADMLGQSKGSVHTTLQRMIADRQLTRRDNVYENKKNP